MVKDVKFLSQKVLSCNYIEALHQRDRNFNKQMIVLVPLNPCSIAAKMKKKISIILKIKGKTYLLISHWLYQTLHH